jgi:hypothetical protein
VYDREAGRPGTAATAYSRSGIYFFGSIENRLSGAFSTRGLPSLADADIQSVKRDLIAGSLLEKKSAETYYFPHRSFIEFLVGEYMCLEGSPPSSLSLADFAGAISPEIRCSPNGVRRVSPFQLNEHSRKSRL